VRVLPGTPMGSAAPRRGDEACASYRDEMLGLVNPGLVEIIGPIRQEILSGIRDRAKFEAVTGRLRVFPDTEIGTGDYEETAACFNRCRSIGIRGPFTDLVICAVAIRHGLAIFTDEKDFPGCRTVLPIRLYAIEKGS